MLNVTITIDDGIKKSELILTETDNLTKLIVIQQVFSLFGANQEALDMISTYEKIGAAYNSFFNNTNPIENHSKQPNVDIDPDDIKEQMENGFRENLDELNKTYTNVDDEYITTGIKDRGGVKRYKLYYVCESCGHRGTHYIYPYSAITWCHDCRYEMKVHTAHPTPMERDSKGNFFRAGNYKDTTLEWNV
jgi:hypothetical protein